MRRNIAFTLFSKNEHDNRNVHCRALILWAGLSMLFFGLASCMNAIDCPSLVQADAANSVNAAVTYPVWRKAGKGLERELNCMLPEGPDKPILKVSAVAPGGPDSGDEIIQLALSYPQGVEPLLAMPAGAVDADNNGQPDFQLMKFFSPKIGSWQAVTPDQVKTTLAEAYLNSATGQIELENSGAVLTATKANGTISLEIQFPDGSTRTLSPDELKQLTAASPWLDQAGRFFKDQEVLSNPATNKVVGVDPVSLVPDTEKGQWLNQGIPDEVRAAALNRGLLAVETIGGVGFAMNADSCRPTLPDHLFDSGAVLNGSIDSQATYKVDGQSVTSALAEFKLANGLGCAAFVAKEGNSMGLEPGTTVLLVFENGGKTGQTRILNPDNPLQFLANDPNTIQIKATENGLIVTRKAPDGTVIDTQEVLFLPPLLDYYKPEGADQVTAVGLECKDVRTGDNNGACVQRLIDERFYNFFDFKFVCTGETAIEQRLDPNTGEVLPGSVGYIVVKSLDRQDKEFTTKVAVQVDLGDGKDNYKAGWEEQPLRTAEELSREYPSGRIWGFGFALTDDPILYLWRDMLRPHVKFHNQFFNQGGGDTGDEILYPAMRHDTLAF